MEFPHCPLSDLHSNAAQPSTESKRNFIFCQGFSERRISSYGHRLVRTQVKFQYVSRHRMNPTENVNRAEGVISEKSECLKLPGI